MVQLRVIKQMIGCASLVLAFALLAGCQSPGNDPVFQPVENLPVLEPATSEPAADAPAANVAPAITAPTSEKFNVGDMVVVNFSGLSDVVIPAHEERVKEDGMITLPFIGSVMALGMGPGELQKAIRAKYVDGKIYPANLNVTVKGLERFFFVDGEVRMPNRYVWAEGMTVLKAVSSAGGFTDFARKSRVTVTRLDGRKFTINCDKAMENPELDLPVYPGDRVHVKRRFL